MSEVAIIKRPHLNTKERAALLTAVHDRLHILFPICSKITENKGLVFFEDKEEAWEQITVIVNAVENKNWSAKEIELMYIRVMRNI